MLGRLLQCAYACTAHLWLPLSLLSLSLPLTSSHLPSHAGKLVRSGEGGRGTPFAYTATAKGQEAVAEARQKLQADAELLRSAAPAGNSGTAGGAAAAAGEAAGDEAAA